MRTLDTPACVAWRRVAATWPPPAATGRRRGEKEGWGRAAPARHATNCRARPTAPPGGSGGSSRPASRAAGT